MEDLLRQIDQQVTDLSDMLGVATAKSKFTSVIKYEGHPILPPVMTSQKRDEMRMYRRQAILTETKIRARMRQKLLARVQSVISAIDERHTPVPVLNEQNGDVKSQQSQASDKFVPNLISCTDKEAPTKQTDSQKVVSQDSGFSSRVHNEPDNEQGETMPLTDRQDTMADITDISSVDDGQASSGFPSPRDSDRPTATSCHTVSARDLNLPESPAADRSDVCPELTATDSQTLVTSSVEHVGPEEEAADNEARVTGKLAVQPAIVSVRSSSSATVSSEEMNRTIISRDSLPQPADLLSPQPQEGITTAESCTETLGSEHGVKEETKPDVVSPNEHVDTREDRLQIPPKENKDTEADTDEVELEGAMSTRTSLLSRVDLTLDDGTLDSDDESTVADSEADPTNGPEVRDSDHSADEEEKDLLGEYPELPNMRGSSHNVSLQSAASGATVSDDVSGKVVKQVISSEGPSSMGVDTSQLYTESTELGPYMATSLDTIHSSVSTMPHFTLQDTVTQASQQTGIAASDVNVTELEHSGIETTEQTQNAQQPQTKQPDRIRRDSYNLDEPSPALLNSCQNNSDKMRLQVSKVVSIKVPSPLTSSMEDLKLKPVQRKLHYDDDAKSGVSGPSADSVSNLQAPSEVVASRAAASSRAEVEDRAAEDARTRYESEREGKEEHLHRYLQALSQMPSASPPTASRDTSQKFKNTSPQDMQYRAYSDPMEGSLGSSVSHGFAQALQTTPFDVENLGHMSEAELLRIQSEYFEQLRRQLVEQQQRQLAMLLAEQEQQQLLLQQELYGHTQPHPTNLPTRPLIHKPDKSKKVKPIIKANTKKSKTLAHTAVQQPDLRPASAPGPLVHFSDGAADVSIADSSLIQDRSGHSEELTALSPAVLRTRGESLNMSGQTSSVFSPRQNVRHSNDRSYRTRQKSGTMITLQEIPAEYHQKFAKLTALAKGFLTRKLLHSDKVQQIIQTIKDTAEFALNFQQETPIKKGMYSLQDRQLQERVIAQLTAAMYEIHEIFFEISIKEQMAIIARSRQHELERVYKEQSYLMERPHSSAASGRVSAATIKAMDRRKKSKLKEECAELEPRAKSAPPPSTSSPKCLGKNSDLIRHAPFLANRALKPIQATVSPIKPVRPAAPSNKRVEVAEEKTKPSQNSVPMKATNKPSQNPVPIKRLQANRKVKSLGTGKTKKGAHLNRKVARTSPQNTTAGQK